MHNGNLLSDIKLLCTRRQIYLVGFMIKFLTLLSESELADMSSNIYLMSVKMCVVQIPIFDKRKNFK